jgi:hypothetical protein
VRKSTVAEFNVSLMVLAKLARVLNVRLGAFLEDE